MKTITSDFAAILRGEQRAARFKYRHSVAAAAEAVGIPVSWVWAWLHAKQLKSRTSLRKVWVRLEAVQELFADKIAIRDAFYATGDFLTSPKAIQEVVERWPNGRHPFIKFQPTRQGSANPQAESNCGPRFMRGEIGKAA
jgi:hypothetical protein